MNAWFSEDQTPDMRISLRVERVLHRERSAYQELAVYETTQYGRLLALDDVIMTTERDEFTYHELIVHVPLLSHPQPRRVCIVGGGDGGAVREVLKHPEVEEVHLVEIDERVIEVSRRFLPGLAGHLDEPRVRIHVADGIRHLAAAREDYDVILVDSTDPVGPAVGLFEEAFYRSVHEGPFVPGGLFAAQTESPFFNGDLLRRIQATLRQIFPLARLYCGFVPTYPGGLWAFSVGSRGPDPAAALDDPARLRRAEALDTRYYTPELHRALFALPRFVRDLIAEPAGNPAEQGR